MAFEVLISNNATVQDVVRLIITAINKEVDSPFVKKLAVNILNSGGDKLTILKRLFRYVCEQVDYERDPLGHERVMLAHRLIKEGKGDCKKMTVFLAATLPNLGIQPLIKLISYNGKDWEHIYVIVPNQGSYITLDPVNNKLFNQEIPHSKSTIFNLNGEEMNKLSLLGALPNKSSLSETFVAGIADLDNLLGQSAEAFNRPGAIILDKLSDGVLDKIAATRGSSAVTNRPGATIQPGPVPMMPSADIGKIKIKNPFKGIFKNRKVDGGGLKEAFQKIGLAPVRGSFLAVVSVNALKLADKLAASWNKNPEAVRSWWMSKGGNPDQLRKAIAKGSAQTLIAGKDMQVQVNGVAIASVAALVAAATPLIVAAIALAKQIGAIGKEDKTDQEAIDDLEKTSDKDEDFELPDDEEKKSAGILPWAAGALLLAKFL